MRRRVGQCTCAVDRVGVLGRRPERDYRGAAPSHQIQARLDSGLRLVRYCRCEAVVALCGWVCEAHAVRGSASRTDRTPPSGRRSSSSSSTTVSTRSATFSTAGAPAFGYPQARTRDRPRYRYYIIKNHVNPAVFNFQAFRAHARTRAPFMWNALAPQSWRAVTSRLGAHKTLAILRRHSARACNRWTAAAAVCIAAGGLLSQELVMLSLQNDFKHVVGVSSWMWLILALQVRAAVRQCVCLCRCICACALERVHMAL
jgi:hypothetical protein